MSFEIKGQNQLPIPKQIPEKHWTSSPAQTNPLLTHSSRSQIPASRSTQKYLSPTQSRIQETSTKIPCPTCEKRIERPYQKIHDSPPKIRPSHHNVVCSSCSSGSYSKILKVVSLNSPKASKTETKKVKIIENSPDLPEKSGFLIAGPGPGFEVHFQEVLLPPKTELTSLIPDTVKENLLYKAKVKEEERKRVAIRRAEYANRMKGVAKTVVTVFGAEKQEFREGGKGNVEEIREIKEGISLDSGLNVERVLERDGKEEEFKGNKKVSGTYQPEKPLGSKESRGRSSGNDREKIREGSIGYIQRIRDESLKRNLEESKMSVKHRIIARLAEKNFASFLVKEKEEEENDKLLTSENSVFEASEKEEEKKNSFSLFEGFSENQEKKEEVIENERNNKEKNIENQGNKEEKIIENKGNKEEIIENQLNEEEEIIENQPNKEEEIIENQPNKEEEDQQEIIENQPNKEQEIIENHSNKEQEIIKSEPAIKSEESQTEQTGKEENKFVLEALEFCQAGLDQNISPKNLSEAGSKKPTEKHELAEYEKSPSSPIPQDMTSDITNPISDIEKSIEPSQVSPTRIHLNTLLDKNLSELKNSSRLSSPLLEIAENAEGSSENDERVDQDSEENIEFCSKSIEDSIKRDSIKGDSIKRDSIKKDSQEGAEMKKEIGSEDYEKLKKKPDFVGNPFEDSPLNQNYTFNDPNEMINDDSSQQLSIDDLSKIPNDNTSSQFTFTTIPAYIEPEKSPTNVLDQSIEISNPSVEDDIDIDSLSPNKLKSLLHVLVDPKVIKGLKLLGGFAEYLEKNGRTILFP